MKKEFELSAKLNTADFDKSVEQIVRKLKDVTQPISAMQQSTAQRAQQNGLGGLSPQTMDAFQKATASARKELDQMITEQVKQQEKLGKFIAQRTESIKKMIDEQKKLVSGSKEELEIREKIIRAEQNQQSLKEAYRQRDAQLNQSLDAKEAMREQQAQEIKNRNPEGWGRVGRYARQGMYGAAGRHALGQVGGIPGALGLAGSGFAAIGTMGAMAEKVTGYGQRLQEARGSAIENTVGQNLRDVYSGRSPFENAWTEERDAAAGLAKQKMERNQWTDRAKGIGGVGAAALGGASAGAAIGSAFPIVGTAIGGLVGGAIGGGAAWLNSNDRTRQSINPFGQDEYRSLLAKDQSEDFRRTYEDLKNQNQEKKQIIERFESEKGRNVNSQRQLGLSNNQFYKDGGFLSNVAAGGYMPGQGIEMANAIVGAGGSSRMGVNAKFGLDMERSGLTNASGILGSLSGSIQNPEANKRATIAIMSEAFKIGLDNTEFAEENRRFAQAAANVVGRTGATSETDQDRIVASLTQFMGQKTNVGVQEAQGAYERSQERGSQTKDRRGALRFQAAMQDEDLSKMDTSDLTELLSMRPEELNTSNPAVAEFARSAGITPKELIDKVTGKGGVNEAGRFVFPGQKEKISGISERLNKYMKENNMSYSDFGDASRQGKLPEDIQADYGRILIEQNKSEAGGIRAGEGIASAGEFLRGIDRPGVSKGKTIADLESGPGRMEDLFTKKSAEGADEARKAFNELAESLMKVVSGADALSKATVPLAATLSNAAARNLSTLPQGNGFNVDTALSATGAQTQPQANKPKR